MDKTVKTKLVKIWIKTGSQASQGRQSDQWSITAPRQGQKRGAEVSVSAGLQRLGVAERVRASVV